MVWVPDEQKKFGVGFTEPPPEKKFPYWLLLLATPLLFIGKKK